MYLWKAFLMHRHFYRPWVLELTSYVTQLSVFQQALTELPASESSKPLFESRTEDLIKTLVYGGSPSNPFGKALMRLFFLLPQLSKCQELICGGITVEPRDDTLTRTKWHHFMSLLSDLILYFSDGPDNLYEPTSADSKNPESAIWSSRQCFPVLGSLLCCILQSI